MLLYEKQCYDMLGEQKLQKGMSVINIEPIWTQLKKGIINSSKQCYVLYSLDSKMERIDKMEGSSLYILFEWYDLPNTCNSFVNEV